MEVEELELLESDAAARGPHPLGGAGGGDKTRGDEARWGEARGGEARGDEAPWDEARADEACWDEGRGDEARGDARPEASELQAEAAPWGDQSAGANEGDAIVGEGSGEAGPRPAALGTPGQRPWQLQAAGAAGAPLGHAEAAGHEGGRRKKVTLAQAA